MMELRKQNVGLNGIPGIDGPKGEKGNNGIKGDKGQYGIPGLDGTKGMFQFRFIKGRIEVCGYCVVVHIYIQLSNSIMINIL